MAGKRARATRAGDAQAQTSLGRTSLGAALAATGRDVVRAPGGVFTFEFGGWPPSKSNLYTIERRGTHNSLVLAPEACDFVGRLVAALRARLAALRLTPTWAVPPGKKKPMAVDPVFGRDVEVDVAIMLDEPTRSRADTDGVLKLTLDALTEAGIWADDSQVSDIAIRRVVGVHPTDRILIAVTARPDPARWLGNPSGRMTIRRKTPAAAPRTRRTSPATQQQRSATR